MSTRKYCFGISLIVLFHIALSSCLNEDFKPEEWALEPELDFSENTILFNSSDCRDTIFVFTNYVKFEASCSEDWCEVYADLALSRILINAAPNISSQQRTAVVSVSISRGNKKLTKNISIVQGGGVWDSIGDFSIFWGHDVSSSQKETIVQLLGTMAFVTGGSYIMGDSDNPIVDQSEPHQVTLSSFYIGKYEITQRQWNALMGSNPSLGKRDDMPVYNISWTDAVEFCTRLSDLTHLDVKLPTEAQWEFAAKGGLYGNGYLYAGSNQWEDVAVFYDSEAVHEPSTVGTKQANELGLFDMSGNVAEYCSDWYESYYVDPNPKDPSGPQSGTFKCVRGGHLNGAYYRLTNTSRDRNHASNNNYDVYNGFRITIIQNEK